MKSIEIKGPIFAVVAIAALLTGCGGGGSDGDGGSPALSYSGVTTPATISSSNASDIAASVANNAAEVIGADTASGANPFGVSIDVNNVNSPLSRKIAEISRQVLSDAQASNLPVGITYSSDQLNADSGGNYFCGGSVSISNAIANGSSQNGTISFNNLCFDVGYIDPTETGQLVLNGSVTVSVSESATTVSYANFTVSVDGEIFSFSGTEVCSLAAPYDCSTLYAGGGGEVYMVSDVTITGDEISGFNINATLFDPTYGSVTVATQNPITFCAAGYPNSGVIDFMGVNGTYGSVTFRTDCTGYDGTYFDGTLAGVFSGDW